MKYIIGAAGILLVIVAGSLFNLNELVKVTDRAAEYISSATVYADAGDSAAALREARALEDYWHGKRGYLDAVMTHEDLDGIAAAIANLVSSAESGNYDDFHNSAKLLEILLEHLRESEHFRWSNVL
jgi:hypothetical protein